MIHNLTQKTEPQQRTAILAKADWSQLSVLWNEFKSEPNYQIPHPAQQYANQEKTAATRVDFFTLVKGEDS